MNIPKDEAPEVKKALKHSGGHGEGHEGVSGQRVDGGRSPNSVPKTKKTSGGKRTYGEP